jgi:hypothetical protein
MHNDASTAHSSDHVNFSAPASLRKWPSLGNQRSGEAANPYLVLDGTLDECLRKLMAYAASTRHLYEIHTAPQPPMVREIMAGETVAELTRLQLFFEILTPTTISSPTTVPLHNGLIICVTSPAAESSAMVPQRLRWLTRWPPAGVCGLAEREGNGQNREDGQTGLDHSERPCENSLDDYQIC